MRHIAPVIAVLAVLFLATPNNASAATSRRCLFSFPTEVDGRSFQDSALPNRRPTAAQLEALRIQAQRRFWTVFRRLCTAGRVPPIVLRPFRRLLLQHAAGADNTVFTADDGEAGDDTLVFQYVFDEGGDTVRLSAPDEADIRDGLICWFAYDRHQSMCEQRLP